MVSSRRVRSWKMAGSDRKANPRRQKQSPLAGWPRNQGDVRQQPIRPDLALCSYGNPTPPQKLDEAWKAHTMNRAQLDLPRQTPSYLLWHKMIFDDHSISTDRVLSRLHQPQWSPDRATIDASLTLSKSALLLGPSLHGTVSQLKNQNSPYCSWLEAVLLHACFLAWKYSAQKS